MHLVHHRLLVYKINITFIRKTLQCTWTKEEVVTDKDKKKPTTVFAVLFLLLQHSLSP